MTIGEKIYKLRRQKGFSQEAVANAVHVSRQAVSKWERNESLPDLDNVRMLCLVLGVSADQLLNENSACEADAPAAVSLAEFFKEAYRRKYRKWFFLFLCACLFDRTV